MKRVVSIFLIMILSNVKKNIDLIMVLLKPEYLNFGFYIFV